MGFAVLTVYFLLYLFSPSRSARVVFMVHNTDPYGIPIQQQTVVPYSSASDSSQQGTSQQYMQPQMQLSYQPVPQPQVTPQYIQYFQDFQNSQRHISSQISQLQSQYADQAAKFQQLGPSFNTQLQSGFTDFNQNFGNQYAALQNQFQQQQLQQQQQHYNTYMQSLQSNQQSIKAQNTQFHSQLQTSIESSFESYKTYISNLLKSHADIFVTGFSTYYNDTKSFLNQKLEDLSRQLSLSADSDKLSQDRLSNQITSIQHNMSTIDRLSGYLTSDLQKVQTLQTEFATQASSHNVENTDRICNILNYLFQSLEGKQSLLQDTLNADRRLSNNSSLSADLYTFTNDLKSEMSSITKYVNSTVDTVLRQRDDRFEQAFNIKLSELTDHLRQSVNQLSSVDIMQQVPPKSKQQSPAVSHRSGNVGRSSSYASQTKFSNVQQQVPPVQTQVPVSQPAVSQQPLMYPPGFTQVPQYTQPSPQQYAQPVQSQPQYQQYQSGFSQPQAPAVMSLPPSLPPPPPPPNPPPGFPSSSYGVGPSYNTGANMQHTQQYSSTPQVLTNSHAGLPNYNGSTPLQPWLRKLEREIQGFQYSDHQAFLLAQSKFDGDVAMWSDQNDTMFMSYRHPTHSLLNQYSYVLLKPLLEKAFSRSQEDFLESLEKVKQQPQESYKRFMRRLQNESQHGHVSLQYIKSLFLRNMHNRNVAVLLKGDVRDPNVNLHQLVREAIKVSYDLGVPPPKVRVGQSRSRSQSPSSFQSRRSRSNRSFSSRSSRSFSPSSFSSSRRSFSPSSNARPQRKYPSSPRYNNTSPRYRDRNKPERSFNDRSRREQPRSSTPQKVSSISRYSNPYSSYDFDAFSQQPRPFQPVYQPTYHPQVQVPAQYVPQASVQQSQPQQQQQQPPPIITLPQQQSNVVTTNSHKGNVVVKDVSNFSIKDTLSNLKLQIDLPQALSQSSDMYKSFMDFVHTLPQSQTSSSHVTSVSARHQIPTGSIDYLWHIPVLLKSKPFQAMLDTGSQPSLLNISVCEQLGITTIQSVQSSYVAANKTSFTPIGLVKLPVQLSDQLEVLIDFYVVKDSSFSVLLGLDFIEHTNMVIYRNKVQVKDPITRRYLDLPLLKQPLYSFSVVSAVKSCSFSFLLLLFSILLTLPRLFYYFLHCIYDFFSNPTHFAFAQFFIPPFHNFGPAPQVFCSPLCFLAFLSCIIVLLFLLLFFRYRRKRLCYAVISTPRRRRTPKHKLLPKVVRRFKLHRNQSSDPSIHILFPKFPQHKKYHLILCDAPWHYDALSPLTPSYRTLSFQQLKSLPVRSIAHDTCIFLYWTTGPMLSKATALARHYGFKHLTVLHSWRKIKPNGSPYSSKTSSASLTQPNIEYLVVGYQGKYKSLMHSNVPPIA